MFFFNSHLHVLFFFLTGATAGLRQPEQLYKTKSQGIITTVLEGREKQEA
jgi:hypothetical protein